MLMFSGILIGEVLISDQWIIILSLIILMIQFIRFTELFIQEFDSHSLS